MNDTKVQALSLVSDLAKSDDVITQSSKAIAAEIKQIVEEYEAKLAAAENRNRQLEAVVSAAKMIKEKGDHLAGCYAEVSKHEPDCDCGIRELRVSLAALGGNDVD